LSGPHKAGTFNNGKMFTEGRLKDKLERAGKKAIGNDGCKDFPNQMSIASSLDSKAVGAQGTVTAKA
jgi:hypothetical protein